MFKEKSASKTIILCILCLSLVLSGCGSASSVSEGGGVIDASGKIVSSDSGKDSDKDSGDKDSGADQSGDKESGDQSGDEGSGEENENNGNENPEDGELQLTNIVAGKHILWYNTMYLWGI